MVKCVETKSGKTFDTLTKAKSYYGPIRESTEIGSVIPEPDFSDILDIYHRYCAATNYPPPFEVTGLTVDWDNRKRPSNTYARTKAFYVVGPSGEKHVFSIDTALSAIGE